MKKSFWWLLLPLGAALTALPLLDPRLGFLGWFSMVPALLFFFGLCERKNLRCRHAYGYGFLYFITFYLFVWHWFIYLYPMEFAGVTKGEAAGLVAICWVGLSLLQASLSALAFPVFAALSKHDIIQKKPLLFPFLFASAYTVAEWAQTLTWMGVPWARLSLGQSESGVLFNSPALFGSYFLTFSIVAVNALISYTVLHLNRKKTLLAACAAVFVCNLLAGTVGYFTSRNQEDGGIVVAAVQGNVGSSNKWSSGSSKKTLEVYEKYTAEAAEQGAELVLFPETFLPYVLTQDNVFGGYVCELAKTYRVTIRCGGFYVGEDGETYNGIFTVYPDGTMAKSVYTKQRLVPFGEYVPMRSMIEVLVPPLADIGMLSDDLAKGNETEIIHTVAGDMGTLVCFDSIYEELTLRAVRDGAEVICLSTNDSWFLDSAGVYMHHTQARLRAVESGRYIIRSADTGISSIITSTGKAESELPPLVEGVSISTVYPTARRTLYSYIGNTFVYLLIAAELMLATELIVAAVRRRRTKIE